jgi:hypothetical protein
MRGRHFRSAGGVIGDTGGIPEALLDLGADDRRDLLRRPGWTSTALPARRVCREVEHIDGHHRVSHRFSYPILTAPPGQNFAHIAQPVQSDSSTVYPFAPG